MSEKGPSLPADSRSFRLPLLQIIFAEYGETTEFFEIGNDSNVWKGSF